MSYRELGKLPRSASYRLILQLGGCMHGTWLSVADRCGPVLRARRGTAGEDDVAHTPAATAPGRPEGEARPRWPTATVASREGGAAARAAKSAQQPAGSPAKSGGQVGKGYLPDVCRAGLARRTAGHGVRGWVP